MSYCHSTVCVKHSLLLASSLEAEIPPLSNYIHTKNSLSYARVICVGVSLQLSSGHLGGVCVCVCEAAKRVDSVLPLVLAGQDYFCYCGTKWCDI